MKNTLHYLVFTFLWLALCPSSTQAQCRILQDSLVFGDRASYKIDYYYDAQNRINRATFTDSANTMYYRYDTLYYNAGGFLEKVEGYDVWPSLSMRSSTVFTYNGNNQIIKLELTGIRDTTPWTMTYDAYYNGANELTDLIVDTASITGNPEGMDASFRHIVWSGGNIV